jgi:hypothetical protein
VNCDTIARREMRPVRGPFRSRPVPATRRREAAVGRGGSNLERLQEAGVIDPEIGEIPVPYARFVDGLTWREVDALITLRNRLLAADEWQKAVDPDSDFDAIALLRAPH